MITKYLVSHSINLFLFIVFLFMGTVNIEAKTDYLEDLPPLIDRDLFFGDPQIAGAQLSPDGQFITFLKPYKEVRNIYVKTREQAFEEAKPITADERPVTGYFWSRDSRYVLYVQDKGGNENFHIYKVDPTADPAESTGVPPAQDLTPIEGIRANIYSLPKDNPNEIIVGLNDRDKAYHDVYKVDLTTGDKVLLFE
ncbi:MAG: S9 family peptidase, partial [bacterium]